MSLNKLYYNQIDSITSTDGKASYMLRDPKDLIAFILQAREANDNRILNQKARLSDDKSHHALLDHADHVVSAKLVQSAIMRHSIKATVKTQVFLRLLLTL